MIRFLLDSNTVSALTARDTAVFRRAAAARRAGCRLILSPVVEYEVRRGFAHRPRKRAQAEFERLIPNLIYTPFGRSTWQQAIDLWAYSRKAGQPIADADILIAAQTMELEAVLVTDNAKHFEVFKPLGLVVENWKQDVLNG